ncbi:DHH family phosphoesterase [Sinomicrobium weinanense]|uniref:Bifunctional oligoribonuclease/PAP phosphatase NrnA n=1 Tax=Sinomicrobium weinanense TaxID=2842200 RepID=A0A926Q4M3_9FLAO|nr:bifunctional oligoribonuclease/PAP phosphatase NrnA [Sinomicrobium weinanense]MBC9797050.1 bifunctional oligoribonuclease/PAP phosphatase NrnA [Sinomicrobium weinanense]MBU3122045.1 bifunctional oligoribonuclease/PAP phosphatase NrnA [Sinomicrobium weinanense]
MNTNIQELAAVLASPKNIVIVPHKNPDGDAIGSSLAMYHYLTLLGHNASVIAPNEYPDFLKWMPGNEHILKFDTKRKIAKPLIEKADLIFTLDFNSLDRVEDMKPVLEKSKAVFAMIDHHEQPDDYAKYTYSDPKMGSTCEMIYHFIDSMEHREKINRDIATCIYTGIMTDTGSFRFPSTTSITHRVVADLIDKGAENADIHNAVYDTNGLSRLHLLGCALKNLVLLKEYNTVYITLNRKELEQFGFRKGDTEGFVNYGLSLKDVKFSVIFIEDTQEDFIKISLRSVGNFSVNALAREHFNGGGHINAAGGRSDLPMEETIEKFKTLLADYKEELTV